MSQLRNLLGTYEAFREGVGLVTLLEEVNVPDIKWKLDDYHGGGLIGTRKIKTILDAMKLTGKCAGFDPAMFSGITRMPGMTEQWKLLSSMIVPGSPEAPQKILVTGEMSDFKRDAYKVNGKVLSHFEIDGITSYEEWLDGKLLCRIDLDNQIMIGPDGVDVLAVRRRNTGRG